jgi:hypothetical protein
MKLFLPLVLAFSFSVGHAAYAKPGVFACSNSRMNLVVNLKTGAVNFYNKQSQNFASDAVFNVTSFSVKTTKTPSVAYVVNFQKYGLFKAQISNVSDTGFAELDHEGQLTDDETGGEEIVELSCTLL